MICPVCHREGADAQPVAPTVTVFCCPSCLTTVLQHFARHAEPVRSASHAGPVRSAASTPRTQAPGAA